MAESFYPAAQHLQYPDILASYVRGQMAPLQVQQAQQKVTEGGLKLDQLRQIMALSKQIAGGAQNQGDPTGGIQNGPQGQVSSQPPSQSGSYDGSVGMPPVNTMMALDVLQGRDPLKSWQSAQETRQTQIKLQTQQPLDTIDSIYDQPRPAKVVDLNPGLKQRWNQMAPQLGFDPTYDFNDQNVRQVLAMAGNQLRGMRGESAKEYPVAPEESAGPLNSVIQHTTFGGTKVVKPEESLHPVIGASGQPELLPGSQAVGRQPFNASIFGAANLSDQAKEFAYQTFVATGKAPANLGRSPAMQAAMMDYIAKRAGQDGNQAAAIAANGQAFTARQGVVKGFESGAEAKTINGINTAVQHMAALDPLVDALGTGDIKVFNKVSNAFKQQTGNPAPTNYAALKEFVGGEVAKAVLPGGGGESERQALTAPLNAANSPTAIKQAVQTIKTALAGKTEALRNQWDVGTNGTQGNFDKFLLPETKKALGIAAPVATAAHPPEVQSLLDKYR